MKIESLEIPSERLFFSRCQFLKGISALTARSHLLAACAPSAIRSSSTVTPAAVRTPSAAGKQTDGLGDAWRSFCAITSYNDYYEFSPETEAVASLSKNFVTEPWTVAVSGLVQKLKGSSWPRN